MAKKILFIEDDGLTNEAYEKNFEPKYECAFALNGKVGIQKARDEKPNVIILDIMLPGGMNGFDVLRELKLRDETKAIPVIVLTNLGGQEESILSAGAVACLIKTDVHMSDIEKLVSENTV